MSRRKTLRVSARLNMVKSTMHAINPRIPDILAIEPLGRPTVPAGIPPAFPLQKEQPAMNQPSQPKVEKSPIRKISQKDFFRLCEWIKTNIPEGMEITHREIARQAGEELGVEISESSVPTALEAIGKTIRSPSSKGGASPYKQSLGVLAKAILLLSNASNVRFPPELEEQLRELAK